MLALRRAVASIASSHARKPAPPVSISEPRTGDCAASRMAARQKAVTDKPSDSAAATTCARSSSVSACWSWTASRMALPSKLGWSRVQRGGDGVHLGALLGGQSDVQLLSRHRGTPAIEGASRLAQTHSRPPGGDGPRFEGKQSGTTWAKLGCRPVCPRIHWGRLVQPCPRRPVKAEPDAPPGTPVGTGGVSLPPTPFLGKRFGSHNVSYGDPRTAR